ncbi:hypothetical protein [Micromonospora wenchangensis]|uniref:hypothetical protein n=1 Tax=Micromonospora wenchangensis TaxID=1185415 RepID=UPI003D756154
MTPGAGGGRVYRVHWVPGTDTLRGICHCGAQRLAEEPVALWQWLLDHPRGHHAPTVPVADPAGRQAVPA